MARLAVQGLGGDVQDVLLLGFDIGAAAPAIPLGALLTQLEADIPDPFLAISPDPEAAGDIDHLVTDTDLGFAQQASLTAGGTLTGIWDDNSYEGGRGGPRLWIATADLGTLTHGDTMTIDGRTFSVEGIQPDGTGITTLILEQQ